MSMSEFVKAKVANISMPHLVFCYLCSDVLACLFLIENNGFVGFSDAA